MKFAPHTIAVLKIVQVLMEGPASCRMLSEESGMSLAQTRVWVQHMRHMKLIHISVWETNSHRNNCIPLYSWGDQKNKEKQRKRTQAEKNERERLRRQRLHMKKLHSALTGDIHAS